MKILYLSMAAAPDYQCDMLFHGLRSLIGESVVDVNKLSYLYQTYPEEQRQQLYGRGFSLYGLLEDSPIDRDDIPSKIRHRYFDRVIYGSIHRCQLYLDLVFAHYDAAQIAFVDGEDQQYVLSPFLGRGFYFKREMSFENRFLTPIHFAIPATKFVDTLDLNKQNLFAPCDPRDRSTYIYHHELDYQQQYRQSFFGVTLKKAGWDCLRHYEILSQGCVPYFIDLPNCPVHTMHRFPKYETLHLMDMGDRYQQNMLSTPEFTESYFTWATNLLCYSRQNLSTIELARYVLNHLRASL